MSTKTRQRRPAANPASGSGSRSKVDPRIAARRIEVRRDEGRRRLRTLVALAIATVGVLAAVALANSSVIDVDDFVVDGASRSSSDEVVQATGISPGDPLLDLDTDGAARSVEGLPWVLNASVERSWNGTITVSIVERVPLLALPLERSSPSSGSFSHVLIDARGRQLELVQGQPIEFLPVAGLSASGEVGQPAPVGAQLILGLVENLPSELDGQVEQLMIDDRVLYLELVQGGRVKVGDDASLDEKMLSLQTIMTKVDLRCLWEIDVRVASAPAVTRLDTDGNPRATLRDLAECS